MSITKGHREAFVAQDLPDQFQVPRLFQYRRSGVMSECVGTNLPAQASTNGKTVEDVGPVGTAECPPLLVAEQEVLKHRIRTASKPRAHNLGRLCTEETNTIRLTLATAHRQGSGVEVYVFDPQSQCLTDS